MSINSYIDYINVNLCILVKYSLRASEPKGRGGLRQFVCFREHGAPLCHVLSLFYYSFIYLLSNKFCFYGIIYENGTED